MHEMYYSLVGRLGSQWIDDILKIAVNWWMEEAKGHSVWSFMGKQMSNSGLLLAVDDGDNKPSNRQNHATILHIDVLK